MKAIILGATGMVGSEVLQHCLNHTEITQVVTIGRKSCGVIHPKIRKVEHQNFLDFTEVKIELANADLCFYCVGVYQGQVSKEAFWEITVKAGSAIVVAKPKVKPNRTIQ